MVFTDIDLRRIQVLITALKRAKYDDMHGEELLALAQVYHWVLGLQTTIQRELAEKAATPPVAIDMTPPPATPVVVVAQPGLPSPIQEPEKPSRKVISLKDYPKKPKKKF